MIFQLASKSGTTLDDLTKTLLTIGGTLLVAVIGAVIAWALTGLREQRTWRRDQRMTAYLDYYRLVAYLETHIEDSGATFDGDSVKGRAVTDPLATVVLVGPPKVSTEAGRLRDTLGAWWDARLAADKNNDESKRSGLEKAVASAKATHFRQDSVFQKAVQAEAGLE